MRTPRFLENSEFFVRVGENYRWRGLRPLALRRSRRQPADHLDLCVYSFLEYIYFKLLKMCIEFLFSKFKVIVHGSNITVPLGWIG